MSESNSPVHLEKEDGVAFIIVDNPPVNAMSQAVRQGLLDCATAIKSDNDIRAAVILCEGRTFIAGADIREFGKPSADPQLPDVIDAIENLEVPVVAAIHGTALGGGFELTMGSHYRIASPGSKVGTPEVNIGLIPGAGGGYRLPRLIGADEALSMFVYGKPISVEKANELGAIDEIVDGDLRDAAKAFALSVAEKGPRVTSRNDEKISSVNPAMFDEWRAKVSKEQRGQEAPLRAVEAIEAGVTLPLEEAAKTCRDMFLALRDSRQAAALRHVFFAEREISRVPGLENVSAEPEISSVAIIGAGAMGAGIAMCFANAGMAVILVDISDENVGRGLDTIRKNYAGSVSKGKMSADAAYRALGLISSATEYSSLNTVDLVIEAVFEDMALKKKVLVELDRVCKPEAILATNTSYLDIDEMAAATNRPENVIGLHFFNPAHIMKLLEVVRTKKTSDGTLARCLEAGKRIRKTCVVAGVCFGFIGNRMLNAYRTEALNLAMQGASIKDIDKALFDFGMPMGPFALMDLTGIEVNVKMRAQADPERIDATAFKIVDRLYDLGRLGQRSGAGFYLYEEGNRKPVYDSKIDEWIAEEAKKAGIERRNDIKAEEIAERCMLMLANEGAKILEEGMALRSGDIDVAYIAGYGFPRHIGGPMCWAEQEGLSKVAERITELFEATKKAAWRPADLLVRAGAAGQSLDQTNN